MRSTSCSSSEYCIDECIANRLLIVAQATSKRNAAIGFRDQSISMFHALGKILHAKSDMGSVENVLASAMLDEAPLLQYLHVRSMRQRNNNVLNGFSSQENYPDFLVDSLESHLAVISSFSLADTLCQQVNITEYSSAGEFSLNSGLDGRELERR